MASKNETVEAVKKRMLKWADEDIHVSGRDVLRRQAQQFADRIEAAHSRELIAVKNRLGCVREELEARDAEIARLRETLRQAIVEYCHDCDDDYGEGGCANTPGACFVQEWRKTLEETK